MRKLTTVELKDPTLRAYAKYEEDDGRWLVFCLDNCQAKSDESLYKAVMELEGLILDHNNWKEEVESMGAKIEPTRPPLEFYFWYYRAKISDFWGLIDRFR